MDTVTQITLGAAVGEATLGHKVGYRAALWGAVGGLIPDLDMIAMPLLDQMARLGWHRGLSHSLLFVAIGSPALAWLIRKIHKDSANFQRWTLLFFLALFTHILLDCFTFYGTQIFQPFSDLRVAFNSISIIDPVYTIPLLVGIVIALFLKRTSRTRRIANGLGLILSTAYLLLALGFKFHVGGVAETSLQDQKLSYTRYMTAPTLFNSLLWRITAETDDGYHVGYYSLLDSDNTINFRYLSKNDSLIAGIKNTPQVKRLLWFSDGYYTITENHGDIVFHDLRFGEIHTRDFQTPGSYVFSWKLETHQTDGTEKVEFTRLDNDVDDTGNAIAALFDRMTGQ
jgi:inner membrane protein